MWVKRGRRIFAHSFQPAASPKALTHISREIRSHFYKTQLRPTLKRIDAYLIRWSLEGRGRWSAPRAPALSTAATISPAARSGTGDGPGLGSGGSLPGLGSGGSFLGTAASTAAGVIVVCWRSISPGRIRQEARDGGGDRGIAPVCQIAVNL
jgi:hypothetical protein